MIEPCDYNGRSHIGEAMIVPRETPTSQGLSSIEVTLSEGQMVLKILLANHSLSKLLHPASSNGRTRSEFKCLFGQESC